MAWFKVDDGFYTSHKVLMIPREFRNEALGAWLRCGTWSADKMTDGVVPCYVVDDFDLSDEALGWLIKSGLWDRTDEGIVFHDWAEYQPTKDALMDKKERISRKRSEAGIKSGESRREQTANKNEQTANKTEQNTNPEPEPEPEPVPSEVVMSKPKRMTTLKADWKPSLAGYDYARERAPGLNVAVAIENFMDYNLRNARTNADWDAAWRTWVRKAVEFDPSLATPPPPPKRQFGVGDENV